MFVDRSAHSIGTADTRTRGCDIGVLRSSAPDAGDVKRMTVAVVVPMSAASRIVIASSLAESAFALFFIAYLHITRTIAAFICLFSFAVDI